MDLSFARSRRIGSGIGIGIGGVEEVVKGRALRGLHRPRPVRRRT